MTRPRAPARPKKPSLDDILQALRGHLPGLREHYGVRSLGVFGSYVRGEERPGSDVDVLVEFEDNAKPSLFGLVALQEELSDALGVKVDLVEKKGLKPYIGKRILSEVVWLLGGDGGAGPRRVQGKASLQQGGRQMPREFLDFLKDIVEAVEQVERFVAGMAFNEFSGDEKTVLAVTKAVENMGEAAKRIPEDVRRRYPEIPWKEMAGMRDRLAHGYFEVDVEVLWQVAAEFLPPLKPALRRVLEAETEARGLEAGGA